MLNWTARERFAGRRRLCRGLGGLRVASLAAQTGFVLSPKAIELRFRRLQSGEKSRDIYFHRRIESAAEVADPFAAILGHLAMSVMLREWNQILHSSQRGLRRRYGWLSSSLYEFSWKGGMVLLTWSGVDYALQKVNYERSAAHVQAGIARRRERHRRQSATKRARASAAGKCAANKCCSVVARATVVITNPNEYAVALEYIPEKMGAPMVVAKGGDCSRKKSNAKRAGTKFPSWKMWRWRRRCIARVEVGDTIPAKLYTAVAEVLAFIYRAQARLRAEQERRRAASAAAKQAPGRRRANNMPPPRRHSIAFPPSQPARRLAAADCRRGHRVCDAGAGAGNAVGSAAGRKHHAFGSGAAGGAANFAAGAVFRFSHAAVAADSVSPVAKPGQHAPHSAARQRRARRPQGT